MRQQDMIDRVLNLPFEEFDVLLTDNDGVELSIFRPRKVPKRLRQNYDPNKNFQIWLKEDDDHFRPNHLRLMIDLDLRVRSRPDLQKKLLTAFDDIFYGEDPEIVVERFRDETFEHELNSLLIITTLMQLFVVEQAINYTSESKFDPPTLFLLGWVRAVICGYKEIDNICMSIGRFQPPPLTFTSKDNKKHKKYDLNRRDLWYFEE
ncbi:MAG: hypothetical protein WA102_02150 [Candidatus Methanoperedens sp.]